MNFLKGKLKRNNSTIDITDYGAGSRRMGTTRKLATIYQTNTSKGKFGKALFQLMEFYQLESALELGTSLGIGSVCMATGNEHATITTIEGCPSIYDVANENFQDLRMTNINSLKGTFSSVIPTLPKIKYDLIFIDGHHDGEALLRYVEELLPHAHDDTFFLLDDIRWSSSMKEAWGKLKADDRFHVSIDLFRMGMILLRPHQEKEHFEILL